MDNPPIKNWMKQKEFDPFEGRTSFKECSMCKEAVPTDQYFDNLEYASSVCNNCLQRYNGNQALLHKFIEWSRTTREFKRISGLGYSIFSPYRADEIERLVMSAIIHKAERKTLMNVLLKITGDAGDQLLLTEALEELSNLQEGNETKEK